MEKLQRYSCKVYAVALCVLCVHLSVTVKSFTKMAERRIMQTIPHNRLQTL